jgi:hypothetical protein
MGSTIPELVQQPPFVLDGPRTDGSWFTIIGVVGDRRNNGMGRGQLVRSVNSRRGYFAVGFGRDSGVRNTSSSRLHSRRDGGATRLAIESLVLTCTRETKRTMVTPLHGSWLRVISGAGPHGKSWLVYLDPDRMIFGSFGGRHRIK